MNATRTFRVLFVVVAFASCVFASAEIACSTADNAARVAPAGPDPTAVPFAKVANALERRCGSLDCHGSPYRNMRLYGYGGLRIDASLEPDDPGATPDEVSADYDAVVALEPDIMRQVVAAKGQGPDRLTFYRKGRGLEGHKGGTRIVAGDDADKCVLSWLASNLDGDSCDAVLTEP